MEQIQLNTLKDSVKKGRVANTYLLVGKADSDVLGSGFDLVKDIIKSPFADMETHAQQAALEKLKTLTNPDVHYFYPVNTTAKVKTKASSKDFINNWRELVGAGTKITLVDWYNKIELGNKQAAINKDEAEEISRIASLKSYEGGVKIFLIWMAEKMNLSASNKLLKLFEEPPKNTVFILICENEGRLLPTITSRCQKVYINSQKTDNHNVISEYEVLFLDWVRAAFKVKGNKSAINDLILFSEKISNKTREDQKDFLAYCSAVFRDSFLYGYKVVNNSERYLNGLILEKFAPFVHEENIEEFYCEIQKGFTDIERNGNPKIIFLDISIKLTRLLHVKPTQNV
tara:strand:+ start:16 stop:1044 length:1029 start_codon:yes stop_codon:yes gene_type:complete